MQTFEVVLLVIMIVMLGLLIFGGYLAIKDINKEWKEEDDLYQSIHQATTKEEWIELKAKVIQSYAKKYKKSYVAGKTTGSLYGALADKAEEFFKQ